MKHLLIMAAVIMLSPLRAHAAPDEPEKVCSSDVLDLAAKGKMLFHGKAVCASCHGEGGNGEVEDPRVAQLNPKPTNFTDRTKLKYPTDEQRYNAIRNGIPRTAMPAFRGHLTNEEILLLIEYLEVLKTGGC